MQDGSKHGDCLRRISEIAVIPELLKPFLALRDAACEDVVGRLIRPVLPKPY
jgi:hypothetical protein